MKLDADTIAVLGVLRDHKDPSPSSFYPYWNIEDKTGLTPQRIHASLMFLYNQGCAVFAEPSLTKESTFITIVHHYPMWGVARLTAEGLRLSKKMLPQQSPPKPSYIPALYPLPADASWADVEIAFASNDSLRISYKNSGSKRFTFAEFGFKDHRKGDLPNANWECLRTILAPCKGAFCDWSPDINSTLQKRIQAINRKLKEITGLAQNPIVYQKNLTKVIGTRKAGYWIKLRLKPLPIDSSSDE